MTDSVIRARVFTSRSHMYHQDPWGRVGDYRGHRCTTKCRRIWTWHYQVTVNGETWTARSYDGDAIPDGVEVDVIEVDDLTVVVQPRDKPLRRGEA